MIVTTSAGRQVQDVCIRVLTANGEIERVARIEREPDGSLHVRTALGRSYPAEQIISILKGDCRHA